MTTRSPDRPPNAFQAGKPSTDARSREESLIEGLRGKGGVFVEAVRATRMPMVVTAPALPGNPIVFANEAFLKLSGYAMDEVLGQQPHFMNGSDTDPEDAARFVQAISEDHDEVIETVQYRRDGSRFVAAVLLSAFKDADGRTLHHFLSYLDITRRVAAEGVRALKERQAFLLQLSDAVQPLADAAAIEATTARMLGQHLGADRAMYADVEGGRGAERGTIRGQYLRVAGEGEPATAAFPERFVFEPFGPHTMAARYRGEMLVVDDIAAAPGFSAAEREAWMAAGVRAVIVAPLVKDGRLVAEFGVHSAGPRSWTAAEASLVREVAERTWAAVARARAEAGFRESEARYRQALEVGRIGAWETDFALGLRRWSPEAMALFGLDLPDGIGRVGGEQDEWRGALHRDDCAIADAIYERLKTEDAFDVEYRIRRPDGEVLHLHGHARVEARDAAGRPRRLLNVVADITSMRRAEKARDESERRFQTAAEALPNMLFVSTSAGENLMVNESYRRYAGRDDAGLLGHAWADLLHPDDTERGWELWNDAVARGESYEAEYRFRRHDGAWRWHLVRALPIREADGSIARWVGTCTDIHERKAAEDELQEKVVTAVSDREAALRQLHEAQKTEIIGQLTGGVAHDFNNLLAAILSNLGLARKHVADPRMAKLIDGAMKGAERGAALTSRLLAFARRQDLKTAAIDLASLFDGMRDLLARTLRADIEIRPRFSDDLPAVLADANQVELALLNLAVNARDAMPEGGILMFEATPYTAGDGDDHGLWPGRYVRLTVSDTGHGMDAETLKHATEPFFTTKGVGKGTGLGLSMVQGMAMQSGGALAIESEPGRGTAIKLFLPQADQPARTTRAPAATQEPAQSKGVGRRLTTLVVDDDVLVSMGTVAMLEDLGHAVLEANSGQAAIDLIAAHPEIDIVITDQSMPGMTGTQLAELVRQRWPALPIVLASGYADLPNGQTTDLPRLAKPFLQEEIAAVIERVLAEGAEQAS